MAFMTEEEFYGLESVRTLEYYTPLLAEMVGVELGVDVDCSFVAEVPHVDCQAFIHLQGGDAPCLIAINMNTVLQGCDGSYLLFLFAHELGHFLQWKYGLLANASDVSTRNPVTVWRDSPSAPQSVHAYDPADVGSPWEVDADRFAYSVLEGLLALSQASESSASGF